MTSVARYFASERNGNEMLKPEPAQVALTRQRGVM